MNNFAGHVYSSGSNSTDQYLPGNQQFWKHTNNIHFPSYDELAQCPLPLGNQHPPLLPSSTRAEQSVPSANHPSYGNLHIPNPTITEPLTFSMAPLANPCQSLWGGAIPGSIHSNYPVSQSQSQYQNQIPYGPLCGWSRDLESHPVPSGVSSNILQSPTFQATSDSYSNVGDAWMLHALGQDMGTPIPEDTSLSACGFFRASVDYDLPSDAWVNSPSSIAPIHNVMPHSQPQSVTSERSNWPIDRSDRQTRTFECRWVTSGVPCESHAVTDRRSIVEHLRRVHGIEPGEEKARKTCLWEQCRTVLNKESLARHILTVHLRKRAHCVDCGLWFAREDSLKRHLKGCQHHDNVPSVGSETKPSPSRSQTHHSL